MFISYLITVKKNIYIKNIPESKNLNQTLVLAVGKMRSKFLLAPTPGLTLGDSCRIGTVRDTGTTFFLNS